MEISITNKQIQTKLHQYYCAKSNSIVTTTFWLEKDKVFLQWLFIFCPNNWLLPLVMEFFLSSTPFTSELNPCKLPLNTVYTIVHIVNATSRDTLIFTYSRNTHNPMLSSTFYQFGISMVLTTSQYNLHIGSNQFTFGSTLDSHSPLWLCHLWTRSM